MAVTIRDVAREAGVSETTVSLSLRGSKRIGAETRQRVVEVCKALGYTPNSLARGLRLSRSGTIGLVISDVRNPFYSKIILGLDETVRKAGFALFLSNHLWDSAVEAHLVERYISNRVEGLCIAPAEGDFRHLRRVVEAGPPMVFIDRQIPEIAVDCVVNDNVGGAYMAVKHLTELGHRRIAHITGAVDQSYISSLRDIMEGYRKAHVAAGLPVRPELIEPGGLAIQDGMHAMERLLTREPAPTAVFCVNDMAALGAMAAIRHAGLRVPEDVAVVGIDDIDVGVLPDIGLTTICQPEYEMGRLAAEILLERIKDRHRGSEQTERRAVTLSPRLIVRRSSGGIQLARENDS